MTEKTGS